MKFAQQPSRRLNRASSAGAETRGRLVADPSRPAAVRQDGIALFIVLVLVVVLTIVIFQLTFTTKIEERISRNRQGFLELSYTLQAVARSGLQVLETDLMHDLGFIEDEEDSEDSAAGVPGLGNGSGPGNGNGGGRQQERYDHRHEEWAHAINESLNDSDVTLRIVSGEGCIDLNHLFEYPQYTEEELEEIEEDGGGPPSLPGLPGADDDDEDDEGFDDFDEDIDEWEPPTQEQVEDAELILSRLIQSLISANEEGDFPYLETPDPDSVAREVVAWVESRQEEESTRLIRSLEPLLEIDGVSGELYYGPQREELEDDDREADDLFGSILDEFNELPGFEQFDDGVEEIPRPLGLRDVLTVHSSGKINLNVARPEVYAALMLSFEDLDEALEIAFEIDAWLNSYEEAEEGQQVAGEPAEEEEEEGESFQQLKKFDDLGQVNETWTEGDASDDNILDLLRIDLEPVSAYKSDFFTIQVDGERDNRRMRGSMAVARVEMDLIVLSWEESGY